MKNSSPINLNLCQTWLFHLLFGCLFCFDLLWTELRVLWVQQKRSVILVFTVAKNVNFKLSGDEFFMMSISKIMVPESNRKLWPNLTRYLSTIYLPIHLQVQNFKLHLIKHLTPANQKAKHCRHCNQLIPVNIFSQHLRDMHKGQLISKCPLVSSNLPENQPISFKDFCPSLV